MLFWLYVQGDIAAFKDYTAEDAKEGGGGAPKKKAAPEAEAKKSEGKQEKAPQQKPQQNEQKPAPQPKQPAGTPSCIISNPHTGGGLPHCMSGACC